jgi:hypothetical protein
MLKTQSLRNPLFNLSKQFEKIKVEDLTDNFTKVCDASPESQMRAQDGTGMGSGAPGEDSGAMAPGGHGQGRCAEEVRRRPHRESQEGRDGPGDRARRGDPPDRRHPHAPPPEQPAPDRRGRRRQDRRGGRVSRSASHAATCRRS